MTDPYRVTTDLHSLTLSVEVSRPLTDQQAWGLGMLLRQEALLLKETRLRLAGVITVGRQEVFVGVGEQPVGGLFDE